MISPAFVMPNRALRMQRRAFLKELTEFLSDASTEVISKEIFDGKKEYFEKLWDEIVVSHNDCISLLDEDDDNEKEMIEDLNANLEGLKLKKDGLNWLEGDLEKKLAATVDVKQVEPGVIDGVPLDSVKKTS